MGAWRARPILILYKLTGFVAEHMRDAYPEMMESVQRVARVVKDEEHRYATTFQVAEKNLPGRSQGCGGRSVAGPGGVQAVRHLRAGARRAGRHGARVRVVDRPRGLHGGDGEAADAGARQLEGRGEGAGRVPSYQSAARRPSSSDARRWRLRRRVVRVRCDGEIALDRTPFYAEAGGQVGDTGVLVSAATGDTVAVVESAYNGAPGKTVHKVKLLGPVKVGDEVIAQGGSASRDSTMRNHTGTHLLHAALRRVLGTHVKQAGSVVEPSRLRFDFTHYTAMDRAEIDGSGAADE